MKRSRMEILAVGATLITLMLVLLAPAIRFTSAGQARVITLTGIADAGVWTDQNVSGSNYWGDFVNATSYLEPGRPVILRLQSADVIHRFYAPSLGLGPVEVYPGKVTELKFTPAAAGEFPFYCTAVCGHAHFAMRGKFVVAPAREDASKGPDGVGVDGDGVDAVLEETGKRYWETPPPPPGASRVEQGKWHFRRLGCVMCHGENGEGGVANYNYVKDTVPALDKLGERLMLFYPEDVDLIVEEFEKGVDLTTLADDPPIPRFNVFLAQYESVRKVIRNGNPAGKKDPEGPAPPLKMRPWGQRLDENQTDSIIAYLLTLSR